MGPACPVILWLRADHKWPINLLLADTFSISDGGITDFEAISQCNELEWGKQEGQVNLSVPKGGCDSEGAGDDWGKGVAG